MNLHDREQKLYHELNNRLACLEDELAWAFNACKKYKLDKEIEDSVFLCAVWAKDAKDLFFKYSEIRYE